MHHVDGRFRPERIIRDHPNKFIINSDNCCPKASNSKDIFPENNAAKN